MSVSGGMHLAFERGREVGCETMQILTKNNRQWSAPPLTTEAIDAFHAAREGSDIGPVFVHGIYLINPASKNPQTRERSKIALRDELERAHLLGLPWVIIHPGSHGGQGHDVGVRLIAEQLREVIAETAGMSVRICLETTAGQGTSIGWQFEHLAALYEQIDAEERLCICLDTCHIFSAGYEILTAEGYAETMTSFDEIVGIDRLACLHLNDSQTKYGLRRDRHAGIGKGHIGLSAFEYFVNDERLSHIPMVIETPVDDDPIADDRANIDQLRALIRT
jgi:deoxyribonuclease-4